MDKWPVLYICVATGCMALFCAALTITILAERWGGRNGHLPEAGDRRRPDAP
jgi:hypothetical protein